MSSDRVPSRLEVMGWSPQQLADYLKRMNLSGCDKAVMKNNISGSRFVNLSDNDLQKFPKLLAPMISKISCEISKKEEKRGLFGKKTTPKYHEPDPSVADVQGWGEDEFDDEDFDDDYESPNSGDEDGSGGDYESPNDDLDGANDYEPPPSEPPEDLAHKLCPTLPIGDGDYIDNRDNHVSSRGPPLFCAPAPQSPPCLLPGFQVTPPEETPPPTVVDDHQENFLQSHHRSFVPTNRGEIQDPARPPSERTGLAHSLGSLNLTSRNLLSGTNLQFLLCPPATPQPGFLPAGMMQGENNHMMKLLNTTPSPSTVKICPHALDSLGPPHAMETVCLPKCTLQWMTTGEALLDQIDHHFVLRPQCQTHRGWTLAGMWVK
nr:SLP-76 [Trachinotus ovatus]